MSQFKDPKLFQACQDLVECLKERYVEWEGYKQFTGTEERLYNLYNELCLPSDLINKEVERVFRTFEHTFQEMLIVGPFPVHILCPHHLMPCKLKVCVGYIPTHSRVLGLSKFPRVADLLAKRPILQEEYAQDLARTLNARLEPKGVAVNTVGEHSCMGARGVEKYAPVTANVMLGDFLTEPETRAEFLATIQRRSV